MFLELHHQIGLFLSPPPPNDQSFQDQPMKLIYYKQKNISMTFNLTRLIIKNKDEKSQRNNAKIMKNCFHCDLAKFIHLLQKRAGSTLHWAARLVSTNKCIYSTCCTGTDQAHFRLGCFAISEQRTSLKLVEWVKFCLYFTQYI